LTNCDIQNLLADINAVRIDAALYQSLLKNNPNNKN